MGFDWEAFEERAGIMEYDGGLSRFEAETLAAKAQGLTRWEALNVARRNLEAERHQRSVAGQSRTDDMPGMQSPSKEENRPLPEREPDAGRGGLDLLALRLEGGRP
jgi:hypothetical protein